MCSRFPTLKVVILAGSKVLATYSVRLQSSHQFYVHIGSAEQLSLTTFESKQVPSPMLRLPLDRQDGS